MLDVCNTITKTSYCQIICCSVLSLKYFGNINNLVRHDHSCQHHRPGDSSVVPVPSGDDLVAVLAAAEADVDVHVHLLGGAALVDHIHCLHHRGL